MKFIAGLSALFLSLTLFASQALNHYRKFIVIVPVYRELYSQNIGALLTSLYHQDLTDLDISKIDVWFVVNNTKDANLDVRLENQETVTFLKELSSNQAPRIRREHQILREAIDTPLTDRLNIHVLDYTTPGRPERNIGEIRDLGLKAALQNMTESDLKQTLVAQMDADTGFQADYAKTLVKTFEASDLKFVLNTMAYDDQPDSDARVYQRKITTDYRNAAFSFRHAYNWLLPPGGGPRIVATAEAMLEIGGVPHEVVGEDVALIAKLEQRFPKQGTSLDNTVLAKFRARDDGYDAAIYQKQLDYPIEFGEYELSTTRLLQNALPEITQDPLQRSLYEEALSQHLRAYQTSVAKLTSLVRILIHDLHSGMKTVAPASGYPALLSNPWFVDLIREKIAAYGPNENKILADLAEKFPYYFSDPPTPVTLIISQMKAATQAILQKPFLTSLSGPGDHPYLPVFREKYPLTSKHLIADETTGSLHFVPSSTPESELHQPSGASLAMETPSTHPEATEVAPPPPAAAPIKMIQATYATGAHPSFIEYWHRYFNGTGAQHAGASTPHACRMAHAHVG